MGLRNHKIKNVFLTNYTVQYKGTQDHVSYNEVPLKEFSYPMAIMFEKVPAYGLYCRNAENLHLENITMSSTEKKDRPAITLDRVTDSELLSIKAEIIRSTVPMFHFRNSENVLTNSCRFIGINKNLFEVEYRTCKNLTFSNNDLKTNQKEINRTESIPEKVFSMISQLT